MSRKQTPSDFLKQIIGRPVVVKLNNGVDYRGKRALFLVECTLIVSWCVTFRITTFKLIINLLWYFMIYCIYRRYPIHLSHVLLRALGSLFGFKSGLIHFISAWNYTNPQINKKQKQKEREKRQATIIIVC